jgi:hypothetical protein
MFRFMQQFPENYQNYKLCDYSNPKNSLANWRSDIIDVYVCSGSNGRYEFHVRDDNVINGITYYSEKTGKIEIDSFGDKSVSIKDDHMHHN